MKALKVSLIIFLSILPNSGMAAETAGYYRVWQGFKKIEFSQDSFQELLPSFMKATLAIYGNLLNNYLVAVPPANKPDFIPDEFALVALQSEEDYQRIRNTPEGKTYGESHWRLFARETSKSAPYANFFPTQPISLESGKAYDLMGAPLDWKNGRTTFYIGLRKNSLSKVSFLTRLSRHVKIAANSFRSMGLRGYLVIAHESYEAAYMNWESAAVMRAAFSSAAGKLVQKDAAEFMDTLQWLEADSFDSRSVTPGHFYETGALIPKTDKRQECYERVIAEFCKENDCQDHIIYGVGQRQAAEECCGE